jgi:hypothetical protein
LILHCHHHPCQRRREQRIGGGKVVGEVSSSCL